MEGRECEYFTILVGNIVSDEILQKGDAVVNPTNSWMRYGSGVCGAIYKKAGVEILTRYVREKYGILNVVQKLQKKMMA